MRKLTRCLGAIACLLFLGMPGIAHAGDKEPIASPTPTFDLLSLLPEITPAPLPTIAPISTFTPDGNGTVLDNVTDEDGKEFFTITTPSENVFFLVIDRQRDEENVYFLNAVTEQDLMALAAEAGVEPAPTPEPPPTPEPIVETTAPEPEKKAPKGGLIVGVLLLIAGGAGFYYFKFVQPGQGKAAPDEDEDYEDYEDEDPGTEEANLDQEAQDADNYEDVDE